MNIDAVIFDMDGLLINSERIAMQTFMDICAQYGQHNVEALYMTLLGTNNHETLRRLKDAFKSTPGQTLKQTEQLFADWESRYQAITTETPVDLMDAVPELLDFLDDQRIPAAVATSTDTSLATRKLQNAGIHHRFQFIVGGDQIVNSKPAPDIYLRAASLLGVLPERCLALEDSPNGVRAAMAAGMFVVQIPDILPPDQEVRRLGHQIADSLGAIPNILRQRCPI